MASFVQNCGNCSELITVYDSDVRKDSAGPYFVCPKCSNINRIPSAPSESKGLVQKKLFLD